MKSFFLDLLNYSVQSNSILIALFEMNEERASPKAIELFSHILNTHHNWNNRVIASSPQVGVWEKQPVKSFKKINDDNYAASKIIIETLELQEIIRYANSNGDEFTNRLSEIIFHIINHSTYHRAQIAAIFREQGVEPPITDYIFFRREPV